MKVLFALVCVSLLIKTVCTAVFIQPPVDKPPEFACEEGCYNPDLGIVLPYNITYSPQDDTTCLGYLCKTDGNTQIFTCGALGIGTGCRRVPGDLTKPYPNCCDNIDCDPLPTANATATGTASATATATAAASG